MKKSQVFSREKYVENIRQLGIPLYRLAAGYIKPLYLEPIFQEKDKFKNGFPFSLLSEKENPIIRRELSGC